MRYGLSGAGLATYGDRVVVTGGVGKGGILKGLKRVLIYNARTNRWSEGPEMLFRRKCHSSGVVDGIIYAIGGTDEQQAVMQNECLDLKLEKAGWKQISDLPVWINGSNLIRLGRERIAVVSTYAAENDKVYDVCENR